MLLRGGASDLTSLFKTHNVSYNTRYLFATYYREHMPLRIDLMVGTPLSSTAENNFGKLSQYADRSEMTTLTNPFGVYTGYDHHRNVHIDVTTLLTQNPSPLPCDSSLESFAVKYSQGTTPSCQSTGHNALSYRKMYGRGHSLWPDQAGSRLYTGQYNLPLFATHCLGSIWYPATIHASEGFPATSVKMYSPMFLRVVLIDNATD